MAGMEIQVKPSRLVKCLLAKLINTTYEAMMQAIKIIKDGVHLGDIGATIQNYVGVQGFSVVQDFCGHGIGSHFIKNQMFYTMVRKVQVKKLRKEWHN